MASAFGRSLVIVGVFAACSADPAPVAPPAPETPDAGPVGVEDASPPVPPPPDAAPPGFDDPSARSGTRLRVRYLEGGPDAYRTTDLWDKELAASCRFQRAADGELRCLPLQVVAVYYADATCTAEPFMLPVQENVCGDAFGKTPNRETIFRRTTSPKELVGEIVYYPDGAGGCTATFGATAGATVAEALPSTTFVRGAAADEPRADGMVARYVEGEDGSRYLQATRDVTRGTDCDLAFEPGRCVPSDRAPVGLFSNAGCTMPVGRHRSPSPPAIIIEHRNMANGCLAGVDYYEVGAKLAADATLYGRDATGTCTPRTRDAAYSYYARGAPISLSSFPEVTLRLEGTGRLRARRHADADGKPLAQAHAFWDAERDRECRLGRFDDGAYRCFPVDSGLYDDGYFSDVACSSGALASYHCRAEPGPHIVRSDGSRACVGDVYRYGRVYERGPAAAQVYFTNPYVPCEARPAPPSMQYFNIGASVASSVFPAVELKTE